MTGQPRRRPLRRDDDFERLIHHYDGYLASLVDLAEAAIKAELADAGWPAGTPEDDRQPSTPNADHETSSLDYADLTGNLALRYQHLTRALQEIRDHKAKISSSAKHLIRLAPKLIPPNSTVTIPACDVTTCDNPVERKVTHGRTVYVDCDLIAGHWVVRPGARPTCSAHRRLRGVA